MVGSTEKNRVKIDCLNRFENCFCGKVENKKYIGYRKNLKKIQIVSILWYEICIL